MDKLKNELHQKIKTINEKKQELSDEEAAILFLGELLAESGEAISHDSGR